MADGTYKFVNYEGDEMAALFDKTDALGPATSSVAGLMSAADKTKLDGISEGAEENVIEGVKLGDTDLEPTEKVVTIPVDNTPAEGSSKLIRSGGVAAAIADFITRSVNDLANYYLKSETYTKAEVQALIAAIKQFSYRTADTLPEASADTMYIIYLIPSTYSQAQNVKDEFITVENNGVYSWEQIGSTAIDLSGYVTDEDLSAALADYTTTTDLEAMLDEKADKEGEYPALVAGSAHSLAGVAETSMEFLSAELPESAGTGAALLKAVKGKSIVWNQYVNVETSTFNECTITKNANGTYTVSGSSPTATRFKALAPARFGAIGHKLLYRFHLLSGTGITIYDIGNVIAAGGYVLTDKELIYTQEALSLFMLYRSANVADDATFSLVVFDLTLMFGAGNEPSTVEEFKVLFPLPYYAYNPGEVLPFAGERLESEDEDENTIGSITLNPATIKDKDGNLVFPYGGMHGKGTAYDELTGLVGGFFTKGRRVWNRRAYTTGDESDASVITDGSTYTFTQLATPVEVELAEPIPATLPVQQGGTLAVLPENTDEPYTAPASIEVNFPLGTSSIITKSTLTNLLEAMKIAGVIAAYTMTYDASTGDYTFTITK